MVKIGELPHRRTKGLLRPSGDQVESVNLPEFADQTNAGQALGASGCDRLQECKCLHNTIQRRVDGIETCGGLKAQLQAVEQTGSSREKAHRDRLRFGLVVLVPR